MKRLRSYASILSVVVLVGCGSGAPVGGLRDTLGSLDRVEPSQLQYEASRNGVVTSLKGTLEEHRRAERSPARKIKKLVAGTGAAIALGSTVASLVVDDPDTQAAIAQSGAAVAGVAGIVAFIPFGSGAEGAKGVTAFLETQIPRFESRWPETLGRDPSPEEWSDFRRDAGDIERTLSRLKD